MVSNIAMFNNPTGLLILVAVIVLLFGGNKIPEMMRGLGTGMREFKQELSAIDRDEARTSEISTTEPR